MPGFPRAEQRLLAALIGDLVLLPAILAMRPRRETPQDGELSTTDNADDAAEPTEASVVPAPHLDSRQKTLPLRKMLN